MNVEWLPQNALNWDFFISRCTTWLEHKAHGGLDKTLNTTLLGNVASLVISSATLTLTPNTVWRKTANMDVLPVSMQLSICLLRPVRSCKKWRSYFYITLGCFFNVSFCPFHHVWDVKLICNLAIFVSRYNNRCFFFPAFECFSDIPSWSCSVPTESSGLKSLFTVERTKQCSSTHCNYLNGAVISPDKSVSSYVWANTKQAFCLCSIAPNNVIEGKLCMT